jgi:hypothetical protein
LDGFAYYQGLYPTFALSLGPYIQKTQGIGIIAKDMNPKSDVAQPIPRASYMKVTHKGKTHPTVYRARLLAPMAEAVYFAPYVSVRYIVAAIKIKRLPHPKNASAITGQIQWMSDRAVHANQNKEIGMRKLPAIAM